MFNKFNPTSFPQPSTNAFGSTGFGATATPFGQTSTFGSTIQNKPFGSTSFGATPTASTMFGSTAQPQPVSNLFGSTNPTTTPAFGQPATTGGFGSSFGMSTATQPSLFGQTQPSSGLFGASTATPAFGATKPFGATPAFGATTSSSVFGAPQQTAQPISATPLFGQTQTTPNAGLFGAQPTGFGTASGTSSGTVIKFNPVTGSDTMMKNQEPHRVNVRHNCITCMKEYENKSLEELRYEDYMVNRKGPQQGAQPGLFGSAGINQPTATPLFGAASTSTSVFGATQPTFGQTNNNTSLFGKPAGTTPAFGAPTTSASPFAFNSATTTTPFGANTNRAFGTSPFSTTTTNQTFGAPSAGAFGTGTFAQQQPTQGLFGQEQKPATGMFGSAIQPATTNVFGFGSTTTPAPQTNLFGATKPLFGATSTGFGATTNTTSFSFGQTAPTFGQTQTPAAQPLFGASTFNKPASFGLPMPSTSTGGLFSGGSTFNTNANQFSFGQNKPLFGGGLTTTTASGFGGFQTQPPLFGQTTNPTLFAQPTKQDVHELILSNGWSYPSSEHFKNLTPLTGDVERKTMVTNSVAQQKLLDDQLSLTTIKSPTRIHVQRLVTRNKASESMFSGIDEDFSTEENLSQMVKSNPKRLSIKKREVVLADSPGCKPVVQSLSFSVANGETVETPKAKTGGNSSFRKSMLIISNHSSRLQTNDETTDGANEPEPINVSSTTPTATSDYPAGIILTRPGYYTIPPREKLTEMVDENGHLYVEGFAIGRKNYGNVFFPDRFDISGLNIDELVFFRDKELTIYLDDEKKPPIGDGLNRRAQVTLDRVYPRDRKTGQMITSVERLFAMDYENTLRQACEKQKTHFKEYRPETGSWVFLVDHFSRVGINDDEEEEINKDNSRKSNQSPGTTSDFQLNDDLARVRNVYATALERIPEFLARGDPVDADKDADVNANNKRLSAFTTLATKKVHRDDEAANDTWMDEMDDDYGGKNVTIGKDLFQFATVDDESVVDDLYEQEHGDILTASQYVEQLTEMQAEKSRLSVRKEPTPVRVKERVEDRSISLHDSMRPVELPTSKPQDTPTIETRSTYPKRRDYIKPTYVDYEITEHISVEQIANELFATTQPIHQILADHSLFMGNCFTTRWTTNGDLLVQISAKRMRTLPTTNDFANLHAYVNAPRDNDTWRNLTCLLRLTNVNPPRADSIKDMEMSDSSRMCVDYRAKDTLTFATYLNEHLDVELKHNTRFHTRAFPLVEGVKFDGSRDTALHGHVTLAEAFYDMKNTSDVRALIEYTYFVWKLFEALWGEESMLDNDHVTVITRRDNLSNWLRLYLHARVVAIDGADSSHEAVMRHVFSHDLDEACDLLFDEYPMLATLVGVMHATQTVQASAEQLEQWVKSNAIKYFDRSICKLYMCLAQVAYLKTHGDVVDLAEGLEWLTVLGLHLWYLTPQNVPVANVLESFEEYFTEQTHPKPTPLYRPDASDDSTEFDMIYHLLKIYVDSSHPMDTLLDPITHTSNPLDYHLSWLVLKNLNALGHIHVSARAEHLIHTRFAAQLEREGLWHWAIYVLMHVRDDHAREKSITNVLDRYVMTDDEMRDENDTSRATIVEYTTREMFVVRDLNIPEACVMMAKGRKAVFRKQWAIGVGYFIAAERVDEACRVFWKYVAPVEFINENYNYIAAVLKNICMKQAPDDLATIALYVIEHLQQSCPSTPSVSCASTAITNDLKQHYQMLSKLSNDTNVIVNGLNGNAQHQCMLADITRKLVGLLQAAFNECGIREQESMLDRVAFLLSRVPLLPGYKYEMFNDFIGKYTEARFAV